MGTGCCRSGRARNGWAACTAYAEGRIRQVIAQPRPAGPQAAVRMHDPSDRRWARREQDQRIAVELDIAGAAGPITGIGGRYRADSGARCREDLGRRRLVRERGLGVAARRRLSTSKAVNRASTGTAQAPGARSPAKPAKNSSRLPNTGRRGHQRPRQSAVGRRAAPASRCTSSRDQRRPLNGSTRQPTLSSISMFADCPSPDPDEAGCEATRSAKEASPRCQTWITEKKVQTPRIATALPRTAAQRSGAGRSCWRRIDR